MRVLAIDPGLEVLRCNVATMTVTIPGPPCAQGRGRAVRAGDRVRVVDAPKSRNWKGTAQVHMQEAVARPLDGPLAVSILAVFPCPITDYRKRQPRPRRWHTKANGDLDNITKAVLDAGNGVLWLDDRQVCALTAQKVIGAQGEAPCVVVRVQPAVWAV